MKKAAPNRNPAARLSTRLPSHKERATPPNNKTNNPATSIMITVIAAEATLVPF